MIGRRAAPLRSRPDRDNDAPELRPAATGAGRPLWPSASTGSKTNGSMDPCNYKLISDIPLTKGCMQARNDSIS